MKQLSKWHVLGFIILFIIYIVDTSKIINTYLYYKNGSHFDINYYRIKFPVSHWAYFGESKTTYVVSGNNIGKNNLSAEFFKNAERFNILDIISSCDTVKKQVYKVENMKGYVYLCIRNKTETMYFQSEDKKILIRENDYNSSNEKIVAEYQLLLNSISPRE